MVILISSCKYYLFTSKTNLSDIKKNYHPHFVIFIFHVTKKSVRNSCQWSYGHSTMSDTQNYETLSLFLSRSFLCRSLFGWCGLGCGFLLGASLFCTSFLGCGLCWFGWFGLCLFLSLILFQTCLQKGNFLFLDFHILTQIGYLGIKAVEFVILHSVGE